MRDPSAIHSQLHRNKGDGVTKDNKGVRISSSPGTLSLPPRSLGKRASIAALPSLVRDSWSWAGDTLNSLRDGLSREEREEKQRKEDRKQVLYLKIRNVSRALLAFPAGESSEADRTSRKGNLLR